MEKYCLAWDGSVSYFFDMLGKLEKQVCRKDGLPLAASSEFLAFQNEIGNETAFHMYYHGLLHTWQYMSHLKVKIKKPVFRRLSVKNL